MANRLNILVFVILLAGIALWMGILPKPAPEPVITPSHTPSARPAPVETPVVLEPPEPGPAELPNLRITDVFFDGTYIKVKYINDGGNRVAADFNISLRSGDKVFNGNHYYRSEVPPPGVEATTGGFTPGLVGFARGKTMDITAEIDPHNRVAESNEVDNAVTVTLGHPGEGDLRNLRPAKTTYDPQASTREGPDLIVTDAQMGGGSGGNITITVANQGYGTDSRTFRIRYRAKDIAGGRAIHDIPVPKPGEEATISGHIEHLEANHIVQIDLDADNEIAEGREDNNTFYRQLDNSHRLQEWK